MEIYYAIENTDFNHYSVRWFKSLAAAQRAVDTPTFSGIFHSITLSKGTDLSTMGLRFYD